MRHRYYYDTAVGELRKATIHRDPDCAEIPNRAAPLADSTAENCRGDWCPHCTDRGGDDEPPERGIAERIEAGVCPWCHDYTGDHVGQHASSAHPEQWAGYRDD